MEFNAFYEPWIPAVPAQGAVQEMSIRDVLIHAHELREIADISPLTECGLYRLLITVLMDMLRPRTESDIRALLAEGRLDQASVDAYAETVGSRGDLFDPVHPFLQSPANPAWDGMVQGAGLLDLTLPHGNNHMHTDHRRPDQITFTPAQAARRLPAYQMFSVSMGGGYRAGPNGMPPWYTIVCGDTLFQTLVRSMGTKDMWPDMEYADPPVWWMSPADIVQPRATAPTMSVLQAIMFPCRRIRLIETDGLVTGVVVQPGLSPDRSDAWTDMQVSYRWTKNGERRSWRPDGRSTMACASMLTSDCLPLNAYRQAMRLREPLRLQAYGVHVMQTAKLCRCYRRSYCVPPEIATDPAAAQRVIAAADMAETVARKLQSILNAELPGHTDMCRRAHAAYIAGCEPTFERLMPMLVRDPDSATGMWNQTLRDAAITALGRLLHEKTLNAEKRLALTTALVRLRGALKRILGEDDAQNSD